LNFQSPGLKPTIWHLMYAPGLVAIIDAGFVEKLWFGWIFGVIGGVIISYYEVIMIAGRNKVFLVVVILAGIVCLIKIFSKES